MDILYNNLFQPGNICSLVSLINEKGKLLKHKTNVDTAHKAIYMQVMLLCQ